MKKKILFIVFFLLALGIALISFNYYQKSSIAKVDNNDNKIVESKQNEDNTALIEETKEEKEKSEDNESNKVDDKSNNDISTTSSETNKAASKNSNKKVTNNKQKNNTNNTQNNQSNNSNNNTPTVVTPKEEPKQKTPWEELGLTEEQYKNQPMYSWEEVDFKTKDECMNYGNEHAEYGFECSEVTSWTRSLGWDYKTF